MNDLFFLISWISDAFFVFVTLSLIVDGLIGFFQIKNFRLRAYLRLIPGIALAFMPLLQYLEIGQLLNPLSCGGWLQKAAGYVSPTLKNYLSFPKEIIRGRFFSESFNLLLVAFLGIFIAITMVRLLGKIFEIFWTSIQLKQLIQKTTELPPIRNSWIISKAKKHRICIFVSSTIKIPMAIGSRTILVSQTALDILKPDELESVIGHELAHLIAKDPWTRLFHQLLRAFFWWIPMKKWLKKIEEDQEIACDQMVLRHQEGIGSALVKMAKFSNNKEVLSTAFCSLTRRSPFLLIRLKVILGISHLENKLWQRIAPLIAGPLILLSCAL